MRTIKIEKFTFQYDEDEMVCFFDNSNQRAAFIQGSEMQLVIDIVDHEVVFHPGVSVNIYEVEDNLYQIESSY